MVGVSPGEQVVVVTRGWFAVLGGCHKHTQVTPAPPVLIHQALPGCGLCSVDPGVSLQVQCVLLPFILLAGGMCLSLCTVALQVWVLGYSPTPTLLALDVLANAFPGYWRRSSV